MSFGAHTNASTSFTETIYKLELPVADRVAMNDGLKWFRDVLDGLTIEEREVERERGVILSEATARNSGAMRQTIESLAFLLPETRLAERMPIGQEAIIRKMTPQQLREFYQSWYTPQGATLVIVGDVDPHDLQELIGNNFSTLTPGTGSSRPDRWSGVCRKVA